MRIAVLSDVHANAEALASVLHDIHKIEPPMDELWYLGDLFGYGPRPWACFRMLVGEGVRIDRWVIGNHDRAVLEVVDCLSRNLSDSAVIQRVAGLVPGREERLTVEAHAKQLKLMLDRFGSEDEKGFWGQFRNLPTWRVTEQGIVIAHGGILKEPEQTENLKYYCDSPHTVRDCADKALGLGYRWAERMLMLVGHTHQQAAWACRMDRRGGAQQLVVDLPLCIVVGQEYPLYPDGVVGMVLNPGSVGQPRTEDGDHRAAYMILDLSRCTVQFRRTEYDIQQTIADMTPWYEAHRDRLVDGR